MIQVNHLTRYYGAHAAIQDISFHANQGEVVGLIGLNGAGKSTTLKVLAGVLTPSSGSVTLGGRDVTENADELKATIGFLPEDPPLYREMTVQGFLRYVASIKGLPVGRLAARLDQVLAITGLSGRRHQVIETLSHGFKKRVGIAMAVIHDPALLLLDEPTTGLDPKQVAEMRTTIRTLGQHRVVLLSSHNLTEVGRTCDRLIVLNGGQNVAEGTQQQLVQHLEGTRLRLTLRAEAQAVAAWAGGQVLITNHNVSLLQDGLIRVDLTLRAPRREQLVAQVVQAGFGVWLVEEPDYRLEDLFLRYTSRENAA